MSTDYENSILTIHLSNGYINDPEISNINNFSSCLDHEFGSFGHFSNPTKKESDVYKGQIRKWSKLIPRYRANPFAW